MLQIFICSVPQVETILSLPGFLASYKAWSVGLMVSSPELQGCHAHAGSHDHAVRFKQVSPAAGGHAYAWLVAWPAQATRLGWRSQTRHPEAAGAVCLTQLCTANAGQSARPGRSRGGVVVVEFCQIIKIEHQRARWAPVPQVRLVMQRQVMLELSAVEKAGQLVGVAQFPQLDFQRRMPL